MARARAFDIDRALDSAVDLFWRAGYAKTSVRDLCDAMGLLQGSFYAAFGSKEACFRRALVRYLELQGLPREPGIPAVRAWFKAITRPARRGKGCLLVNAAVDRPLLDDETAELVSGRIRAMEDFFVACLGARPRARDEAALLGAAVVAIHVLVRSGASAARVDRIARSALVSAGLDEC